VPIQFKGVEYLAALESSLRSLTNIELLEIEDADGWKRGANASKMTSSQWNKG
jgi:hypothetical protein